MHYLARIAVTFAGLVAAALFANPSSAATVVDVSLWDKGEVSELNPGATGSLTVALKPGRYLLICNVPGHFASGMWTEFEVTK
jgi:uncharacterized cupredoxin-like copper-binding protein